MIFQTVGSNFTFRTALRLLVTIGTKTDKIKLEKYLAERYGAEVHLFYRGRSALAEAVRLATGGNGKVAVNGFTCYAVIEAVEAAGCQPVYLDIDESDYHFGKAQLDSALKKHSDIKAVIIQNTFGIPCDIAAIELITSKKGIVIIEDLAHSIGGNYSDGREVGTVGDLAICSFGRDKVVDVVNGGALLVRKKQLLEQTQRPTTKPAFMSQFRDRIYPLLSWKIRVLYPTGLGKLLQTISMKLKLVIRSADGGVQKNHLLPSWYCKLIIHELEGLRKNNASRRALTNLYNSELNIKSNTSGDYALLRFPVITSNRLSLLEELARYGYHLKDTWYESPIAPERFMDSTTYQKGECPTAEKVTASIINLPTHRNTATQDAQKISHIVKGKL